LSQGAAEYQGSTILFHLTNAEKEVARKSDKMSKGTPTTDKGECLSQCRTPLKEGNKMLANTVVLQGTVKPDGTLELEGKVPLPPGNVCVTLQPVPDVKAVSAFLISLREIQAIRERDGVKADPDAALAAAQQVRDEFQEQVEEIGKLQEESQRERREAEGAWKGAG
jgi:hypothetical protein